MVRWWPKNGVRRDDSSSGDATYEELVWLLRRSAALMRGGIPAHRVLALAIEDDVVPPAPGSCLHQIVTRIVGGDSPSGALAAVASPACKVVAAAWLIGERSGAPLAVVLDRLAVALNALIDLAHRRAVLVAGPTATVKLVAWLPPAAIGMGLLLGLNPLPVFVTPLGGCLIVLGALLEWGGVCWARRMMARVERADRLVGVECELLWIALAGGAPPALARKWVASATDEAGAIWVPFCSLMDVSTAGRLLAVASQSGVRAGGLLLEASSLARAQAMTQLERQAERLGVRVLVPLATCILPAFVVLGVIPVLVSLLSGVGSLP